MCAISCLISDTLFHLTFTESVEQLLFSPVTGSDRKESFVLQSISQSLDVTCFSLLGVVWIQAYCIKSPFVDADIKSSQLPLTVQKVNFLRKG